MAAVGSASLLTAFDHEGLVPACDGRECSEGSTGVAGPSGCVRWWTEVWLDAYGNDHYVWLDNRCAERVMCTITSSTRSDRVQATVNAQTKYRALIWRGSPATELTADVTCEAL